MSEEQVQEAKWTDSLPDDLRGNSVLDRLGSPENVARSYLELNKAFSGDYVMMPKDDEDVEGWSKLHQKLGVPENAEGYEIQDTGEGILDRFAVQKIFKETNTPKKTAEALWSAFSQKIQEGALSHETSQKELIENNRAALQQKWGEEYDRNLLRSQTVIDKFSENEGQRDFLVDTISSNPMGIEFLAKIGEQFSDHSVDGFQSKSYGLTPDEARSQLDELMASESYRSPVEKIRQAAVQKALNLRQAL